MVELKEKEIATAGAVPQDLYASESNKPPEVLDDSCRKVATMKMDLRSAARARRDQLKKDSINNTAPPTIDFPVRIEFLPGADKGVLQVRAIANKLTKVGNIQIEYFSDPQALVKPPKAQKMPIKRSHSEE